MLVFLALVSSTVVAFTGPGLAACGLVGSMTAINHANGGEVW
jgi:hypothetical protein